MESCFSLLLALLLLLIQSQFREQSWRQWVISSESKVFNDGNLNEEIQTRIWKASHPCVPKCSVEPTHLAVHETQCRRWLFWSSCFRDLSPRHHTEIAWSNRSSSCMWSVPTICWQDQKSNMEVPESSTEATILKPQLWSSSTLLSTSSGNLENHCIHLRDACERWKADTESEPSEELLCPNYVICTDTHIWSWTCEPQEDKIITVVIWTLWPWPQQSHLYACHSGSDGVPSYQDWLQKKKKFTRYCPDK